MIILLTGLPCSGKTTIAEELVKCLPAEWLDGDAVRGTPLANDAGFDPESRRKHLLRMAYVAKLLSRYTDVVMSFVSPSEAVRLEMQVDFTAYICCPVHVCIKRDVKGMYKKALEGEIKDFTGVGSPYEPPNNPDVIVNTEVGSIAQCTTRILTEIQAKR